MNAVLNGFSYPIYAVDFVGCDSVVIAGGGGAVKTGVPNRVDVVDLDAITGTVSPRSTVSPQPVKVVGGVDTGVEAVMNMTVVSAGWGAFVVTVEGRRCVEYLARLTKGSDAVDRKMVQTHLEQGETHVRKRNQRQTDGRALTCPSKEKSASPVTATHISQKWELIKLRTFSLPLVRDISPQPSGEDKRNTCTGLPTCVTSGGRAGSLVAVGTDSGHVFLVDRQAKSKSTASSAEWTPLILYPDVSVGLSAGVCSLSLTSSCTSAQRATLATAPSVLLAAVCDQPSWSCLSVWRTDRVHNGVHCSCADSAYQPSQAALSRSCKRSLNSSLGPSSTAVLSDLSPDINDSYCPYCRIRLFPYAMASCSIFSDYIRSVTSPSVTQDSKMSEPPSFDGNSYRFKHCQFLKATSEIATRFLPETTSGNSVYVLATTVQPLRANRRSISRLAIWLVPLICHPEHTRVIGLSLFTEVRLPRGHMPACLASHPNPERRLIGVGTMDGHVVVYFLSCLERSLTCVYSMDNAHPIFVTALTFLPLSSQSVTNVSPQFTTKSAPRSSSFELVSVSVDRAIRRHSGPSYLRVGRLTRGLYDPDIESRWKRWGCSLVTFLSRLAAIFLLPIFLSLIDTALMWIL